MVPQDVNHRQVLFALDKTLFLHASRKVNLMSASEDK